MQDAWFEIATHVEGEDARNLGATCVEFRSLVINARRAAMGYNELRVIVSLLPNKPWNQIVLQTNPCYLGERNTMVPRPYPECFDAALSLSKNMKNAWNSGCGPFVTYRILRHPAMKDELLADFARIKERYVPHPTWTAHMLSLNPAVTYEDIVTHPEIPWNWLVLSDRR